MCTGCFSIEGSVEKIRDEDYRQSLQNVHDDIFNSW